MPGWPQSACILRNVRKFDDVHELIQFMLSLNREMQGAMREYMTSPEQVAIHRKFAMTILELFKVNAKLVYDFDAAQTLASVAVSKLDEFPELAEYAEDFRRKCVKSHREAAQKRLISFYFNRCEDLCDDMIWEILQRV
jgi:hypothetical protein